MHIQIHIVTHIHIYTYIPRAGDNNEYGEEYNGSNADAEDPDDPSESRKP
jgi:hypothetical protein